MEERDVAPSDTGSTGWVVRDVQGWWCRVSGVVRRAGVVVQGEWGCETRRGGVGRVSKAALEPDIAGALLCIAAAVRFRWNNGGFGSSEHNEQVLSYCTDVFPNSTSCSSMTAQTVLRWVGAPGFDLVLEDDLDKAAPPKRGRAAQASVHRFQPPNRSQAQAFGNEERQPDAAPSAGPNEGGRGVDGGYTFVPKEQPAAATISVLGVKMNQKVTKKAQAQGGSKKQAKQVSARTLQSTPVPTTDPPPPPPPPPLPSFSALAARGSGEGDRTGRPASRRAPINDRHQAPTLVDCTLHILTRTRSGRRVSYAGCAFE